MAKTRHITKRMSRQRLQDYLTHLVMQYGEQQGEQHVLRAQDVKALSKSIDTLKKALLSVHAKGGLVVVAQNGCLITAYALDSYRRG